MVTIKDEKLDKLKQYMESVKGAEHPESYLIAILHKTQELYGYVPEDIMDEIALAMSIPTAHIWGVATFYHYFNLVPQGKYVVSICLGTACYVKGAEDILNALKAYLSVNIGETTEDKLFTLKETRCLGACGLAPVMMVNDKIYGELTAEKTVAIMDTYKAKG